MTFQHAILTCLRKYFAFSGRASRSEYWWFALFCILGGLVFGTLEQFINGITRTPDGPTLLSGAFNLATFLPSLSAGWRRMHDTGRSGLYLLYPMFAIIGLLTFIGFSGGFETLQGGTPEELFQGTFGLIVGLATFIVLLSPFVVLWWLTRRSQPGPNEYGPNPNEVSQ